MHRRAVISPAVALAQMEWRFGDGGLGQARPFAAVPLAGRQGLVGGGRHVGQHFAQVGATLCAAHVFVDDFAPARAHGAADQFVHAVGCTCAFGVGNVVHGSSEVLNDHLVVQGHANFQAMNLLLGWKGALVGYFKTVGFNVCQFGFDVPQAVFTVVALVDHCARM